MANHIVPEIIATIVVLLIVLLPIALVIWLVRFFLKRSGAKASYEKLLEQIKVEQEKLGTLQKSFENKQGEVKNLNERIAHLSETAGALSELKLVRLEIKKYEDILTLHDVALYTPYIKFDTSEEYKKFITVLNDKQKIAVSEGKACICSTSWTVEGSKRKGEQMTKEAIKLALRAFNNECSAVIAKVNSRNIEQSIKQIERSFETINKLNSRNKVAIQPEYLRLKIAELRVNYEYELKKEEERAEQQRIKEEMREEAKAQRELEKARLEAEKAQRDAERELEHARKMLEKDQANTELQAKLLELEQKLKDAQEQNQRAISQAQLTKSGHVYVISNIGSFGENVFKIGMTRRLEPLDRIKELGDASVPFSFDVHAMIYSEDAPALEHELHKVFAAHQVNRVNPRKEFFKVPLVRIAEEVKKHNAKIEFTMLAEAAEYYQSLAMEKENQYIEIVESPDEDEENN